MKLEMVGPHVLMGVEEWYDGRGLDVNSREIRTFACVASITGQGEVLRVVWAAVLFRDNVLDVMGEAALLLAEEAVFATVPGPRADILSRLRVHQAAPGVARYRVALSFRIAMKSSVLM